ncbi:CAP domain-containing protein [Sphaerisporangium fuscum]|uniref:CAP domain-containing protein n=1 Tax=Sphaerisporangium fuscum TaxID=2835868 RepID=UPI0027E3A951|nr:CAP domain-containing protein [Sphaerisporangium fuscum]
MRRPLGVLAGFVSLATISMPIATADAAVAAGTAAGCRVEVSLPSLTSTGKIQSSATRAGCGRGLFRLQVKRVEPGPDPVVRSGSRKTGRLTVTLACEPGSYYAFATDYRGHTAKSPTAKLTCSPTGTPTPSPSPTPTGSASPTPTPTPTPGGVGSAEENEVLRLTNAERAKGGCQPLKHDPQLHQAALGHSTDMATQNYFSHTSKDGRSFMDRIRGAGFTGGSAWAENIAMGQTTPAAVMNSWMNSAGHKANIMNCKYTLIGVGAAKNSKGQIYWTQDFAAR